MEKRGKLTLPDPYYDHAGITIYHGDCLEIMPHLKKVDLVLMDPMYMDANIKTESTQRNRGNVSKGIVVRGKDWEDIPGLKKPFNPQPFLDYPNVILWGANHYCSKLFDNKRWLIWDKRKDVKSDDNSDCELAWTNKKGADRIFRYLWKGICREGRENIAIQGSKYHPFQKPVALMKWCIGISKTKGLIGDFQMGSGTTLVAAKELGHRAIGIEIEEKYCAIAVERLAQEVFDFRGQSGANKLEGSA